MGCSCTRSTGDSCQRTLQDSTYRCYAYLKTVTLTPCRVLPASVHLARFPATTGPGMTTHAAPAPSTAPASGVAHPPVQSEHDDDDEGGEEPVQFEDSDGDLEMGETTGVSNNDNNDGPAPTSTTTTPVGGDSQALAGEDDSSAGDSAVSLEVQGPPLLGDLGSYSGSQ